MKRYLAVSLALATTAAIAAPPPKVPTADADAQIAGKIAADANPGIGFRGDTKALATLADYVRRQGWIADVQTTWLVMVRFGPRPNEAAVLKFLRRLRAKEFGDVINTGIGLSGTTYFAPAPPSPPTPQKSPR